MKVTRLLAALTVAMMVGACSTPTPPKPPPEPESCPDLRASSPSEAIEAPAAATPKGGIVPKGTEGGAAPTLIGGTPVNPAEWLGVVRISSGNSSCSAAVVGPRTVLSAAHCMPPGGTISFTALANRYTARCTHHSEYRGNSTADWAWCYTDREVTGVPFEVVATENPFSGVGDEAQLCGYGCIRQGGGGGNDGILREGKAKVTQLPQTAALPGVALRVAADLFYRSYDTITRGIAALCFGDSGGPAFKWLANGVRVLFGVNSRGDISTTSYLSSTFVEPHLREFRAWAERNNTLVCGLHANAPGCRLGNVPPEPSKKFVVDGKAACVEGALKAGFVEKKDAVREALQKTLDEVR